MYLLSCKWSTSRHNLAGRLDTAEELKTSTPESQNLFCMWLRAKCLSTNPAPGGWCVWQSKRNRMTTPRCFWNITLNRWRHTATAACTDMGVVRRPQGGTEKQTPQSKVMCLHYSWWLTKVERKAITARMLAVISEGCSRRLSWGRGVERLLSCTWNAL